MANRVDTRSRHIVAGWVKERVRSGQLKNCGHLGIQSLNVYPEGVFVLPTHTYIPHCSRDSFEWKIGRLDRDSELHILKNMLNQEPIACPRNCHCYENRYWTQTKERAAKVLSLVRSGLKWLSGLSWQTQLGILLLLFFALAPNWIPRIIELVKAYFQH